MTLARTLKLYKLPEQTQTPGLRPLKADDAPQVRLSALVIFAKLICCGGASHSRGDLP